MTQQRLGEPGDGVVIRPREPHEQLRYLAGRLREGTEPVEAVALALDVLADQLEWPRVAVVSAGDCSLSDTQKRWIAESLAEFASREAVAFPPGDPGLCRKCDVFIGYGALGVAKPPDEHADDREWLWSHCWVCCRSRDEIQAAGR